MKARLVTAADNFQSQTALGGPRDQFSRVTAVSPHMFHRGKLFPKRLQHLAGSIAVLHAGSMNLSHKNIALSVGHDMAFSPFDLLSGVIAYLAAAPF